MDQHLEDELRSLAPQNAQALVVERQRAGEDLTSSNKALEDKSEELKGLIAMMKATLESIDEGLLATDQAGNLKICNRRFQEMWHISEDLREGESHQAIVETMVSHVRDPEAFRSETRNIYASAPEESRDLIELGDGRLIERYSKLQSLDGRNNGRVWTFRDLTERLQTDETRARLAAIVESSDDAIVSKTLEGIITTWNRGAERIFGYTPEEVVGKSISILIPEDRLDEEPRILARLKSGERIDHYQTVRKRKDGTLLDVSLTVSPVRDSTGRIVGVSKIARDITESKRIEQALRDEAFILEFINSTGGSIAAHLNLDSLLQNVTEAATEITGAEFGLFLYNIPSEEGQPRAFYTVSGAFPKDLENLGILRDTKVFDLTFKGEQIVRSEDIATDPRFSLSEHVVPLRSYLAVPVGSRSGEVIGGLFFGHSKANTFSERTERIAKGIAAQAAIALDNARLYESAQSELDEREKVEAALRDSEEHLRAMFSQAAVGIAEANLDGCFTQANLKFSKILGYSPEELLNLTFIDITHPEDQEQTRKYVSCLLSGEISDHVSEKRYLRKDGSFVWSLTTVTMLKDGDGKPRQFIGIIEDITSRKEIEMARQELLEGERAARNEAEKLGRLKDEFLATLSHELRTPLNAIVGWTHLIRKYDSDPKMVQEGIDVIERNARLQTQLVSDLLDMSRVISGKMRLDVQQVQLPVLLEAALESVRPGAETKGVRMEAILDPIVDPVHGDPSRLQQIIWNLVSNAVKFTPRGGKIQVVLGRVGSHVEISVSDTGKGIRPEFLPHLFERFSQQDSSAAREQGGLGIGLALVKQLVELHGGKVRAHSPGEGQGSTFVVEIPLAVVHDSNENPEARLHPRGPATQTADSGLPNLGGLSILVVDDEQDARGLLRRILEDVGATVIAASSADEAFDLLTTEKPDILISDIGMPGRDGYEFIKQVRDAGHTLPAAALTAFARSSDRTKVLLAGFQSHIGKPVEPVELLVTIASLAGRVRTTK